MKISCWIFAGVLLAAMPAVAADKPIPGACGCTERAFYQRYDGADAVFAGTVTEIVEALDFTDKPQADPPVRVTLKITEAYKGAAAGEVFFVHTNLTRHTCSGHPFETGGQYLVFAYERKDYGRSKTELYHFPIGTFDVGGLCGGTKAFTAAGADLKQLKPLPPAKSFFERLRD